MRDLLRELRIYILSSGLLSLTISLEIHTWTSSLTALAPMLVVMYRQCDEAE